jgi:hypothetical protein
VYDIGSGSSSVSTGGRNSDVALIMEDDVKLLFHINFTALIETAPKDFGILQLVTSNEEAIQTVWSTYKQTQPSTNNSGLSSTVDWTKKLWTRNLWTTLTRDRRFPLFWSAQAYLVNKKVIKAFIDDVIETVKEEPNKAPPAATAATAATTTASGQPLLGFKLINSFSPRDCKRTKDNPCILAQCLFSDSYIYAGGGPTYVSNLPLFTGASIGLASSIHQDQVPVHKSAFDRIDMIVKKIRHHHQRLGATKPALAAVNTATAGAVNSQGNYNTNTNNTSPHFSLVPYLINPSGCIPL